MQVKVLAVSFVDIRTHADKRYISVIILYYILYKYFPVLTHTH